VTASTIQIRFSTQEDAIYLQKWLLDPSTLRWFPMNDSREIEDAAKVWVSYGSKESAFTAQLNGEVVGMAVIYIPLYEKLKNQCLFAIIVAPHCRGLGIGSQLIEHLQKVAREKFHIKVLHLEVYDGNPAQKLYQRMGFIQYGIHPKFIKESGRFIAKVLMQKEL
jgi:putative acetyltransferase